MWKATRFFYFLHSNSMKTSVQMLNNEKIPATWHLCCNSDSCVIVSVRSFQDPISHSSRSSSYSIAMKERQVASENRYIVALVLLQEIQDTQILYQS